MVDAGTILTWLDTANGRAPGGAADLDPATGQLLIAQVWCEIGFGLFSAFPFPGCVWGSFWELLLR